MPAPKVKTVKPAPKAKTVKPAPKAKTVKPALKAKAVKPAPKANSIKFGGYDDQVPVLIRYGQPLVRLIKLPPNVKNPENIPDKNYKASLQFGRNAWIRNNLEKFLQMNKDIITVGNLGQLAKLANLQDKQYKQLYNKLSKKQEQQKKT